MIQIDFSRKVYRGGTEDAEVSAEKILFKRRTLKPQGHGHYNTPGIYYSNWHIELA